MSILDGKVGLISGTSGGRGRAAALALAGEDAQVLGCGIKAEEAEETVAQVNGEGGQTRSLHPRDTSETGNAAQWVQAAIGAWGRIDIFYNNASSTCAQGPFADRYWRIGT